MINLNLVNDITQMVANDPRRRDEPQRRGEESDSFVTASDDDTKECVRSNSRRVKSATNGGNKNKKNRILLRNAVLGLSVVSCLLIGYILGASIMRLRTSTTGTAVDNSAGIEIDTHTGIAYANHGDLIQPHALVLKTEEAIFYSNDMDIVAMSNDELKVLKEIILDEGNVKFQVKGYGRGFSDESSDPIVNLIVEGGTLTWDEFGIVDASGDAVNMMLDAAFPPQQQPDVDIDTNDGGYRRRRLPTACDGERGSSSGS